MCSKARIKFPISLYSHPHSGDWRGVYAMGGGNHPTLVDQRAAAGYPLGQEGLLDERRLPRVVAEEGIVSADDSGRFPVLFTLAPVALSVDGAALSLPVVQGTQIRVNSERAGSETRQNAG